MSKEIVAIKPPNFGTAIFHIRGTSPLVIHRFSEKTKMEMIAKREGAVSKGSKAKREPKKAEDLFNTARYRFKDGGDGFQAVAYEKPVLAHADWWISK